MPVNSFVAKFSYKSDAECLVEIRGRGPEGAVTVTTLTVSIPWLRVTVNNAANFLEFLDAGVLQKRTHPDEGKEECQS